MNAIDYFFMELGSLLEDGIEPREALLQTAEAYAHVFHDIQMKSNVPDKPNIPLNELKNDQQVFEEWATQYHPATALMLKLESEPGVFEKDKISGAYLNERIADAYMGWRGRDKYIKGKGINHV